MHEYAVSASVAPTTWIETVAYSGANSDGSTNWLVSDSNSGSGVWSYTRNGALISHAVANGVACTETPALQIQPVPGTLTGSGVSSNTSEVCGGALDTRSISGTGTGVETVAVPAGTFNSFKYVYKEVDSGVVPVLLESRSETDQTTCWTDMQTGITVQCLTSYSTSPLDNVWQSTAGYISRQLIAYAYQGGAPHGTAVPRFAGNWSLSYQGTGEIDLGSCTFSVDIGGNITGSCMNAVAKVSTPASGSVSADGKMTVNSGTAVFVGTFATITTGNGSYDVTGTWSANRA